MARFLTLWSGFTAMYLVGSMSGCASSDSHNLAASGTPPFALSEEECHHLLEIDTLSIQVASVDGPSDAQLVLDAARPSAADVSQYAVLFDVTQSFENLLDRQIVVEEVTAAVGEPDASAKYDVHYDLDSLIVLAPRETRQLTFVLRIPADRLSASYLLSLFEGSALGMTIAPSVRIDIPDSDNCGYPDGIVEIADEGTVKVNRPVEPNLAAEVLGAILKSL